MKKKTRLTVRSISDWKAKGEVAKFFKTSASIGIKRVDVAHASSALSLPGTQVEKIFHEFIKEGRVKQI
ncbi:MAG: hypothetical protein UW86_C0017G0003 [Microgenomates group bacterium GW2011_GWA1_Microgenomates_45_10]|nr:MAG: hypothetical protein UW86_C0017G0003 [Microgenomates group bacterium GW2011_GWA1_Microgenomates_45_10]